MQKSSFSLSSAWIIWGAPAGRLCVHYLHIQPYKNVFFSRVHVFKKQIHQMGSILLWNISESPLIYSDREAETERRLAHLTPEKGCDTLKTTQDRNKRCSLLWVCSGVLTEHSAKRSSSSWILSDKIFTSLHGKLLNLKDSIKESPWNNLLQSTCISPIFYWPYMSVTWKMGPYPFLPAVCTSLWMICSEVFNDARLWGGRVLCTFQEWRSLKLL